MAVDRRQRSARPKNRARSAQSQIENFAHILDGVEIVIHEARQNHSSPCPSFAVAMNMNLKTSRIKRKRPASLRGVAAVLLIALLTGVNIWQLAERDRAFANEMFSMARENYVKGQYDVCLDALSRLHHFNSPTEESKQLESFCTQGKELVKREAELETIQQRQLASENEAHCRKK